jgi:hypothetical protein
MIRLSGQEARGGLTRVGACLHECPVNRDELLLRLFGSVSEGLNRNLMLRPLGGHVSSANRLVGNLKAHVDRSQSLPT